MSQISLKSISGITSITTPTGVDNQLTLHTNNTNQAFKLDSAGNIHVNNHVNITGVSSASNFKTGSSNLHSSGLSAASIDVGSNIKLGNAGVVTATTFSGAFSGNATSADTVDVSGAGNANTNFYVTLADQNGAARTIKIDDGLRFNASTNVLTAGTFSGSGASLTNLPAQATIANNADNRIITGGSGVNLNGEANFTFSGSKAVMKHAATTTVSDRGLMLQASSNLSAGDVLPGITLNPNTNVDRPRAGIAGVSNGGTSGMDLIFMTRYAADGSQLTSSDERFRITSGGKFGFGTDSPDQMVHIHKGSAGSVTSTSNTVLTLENSTTNVLQFLNPNNTAAQVRFGDPQDDGSGFIEYSHAANTMSFGVYGPTRMQIDSNGHLGIAVASGTQLANSKQLTLRPTNDDGIRFIRPGDGNNSPNIHLDLTTTTSGSAFPSGEAYTTKYKTMNCDQIFETYEGGGTGGNISFRTQSSSGESLRINRYGHVTKPDSCAFNVTPNGNQSLGNGETITTWKTTDSRGFENTSTGGYFSSGIFTAPVTGAYFFTSNILLYDTNGTNAIHLYWQKNGSGVHTYWNTRFNGGDFGYQNYMPVAGACTMYMSAGDTCRMRITFTGSNCGMYGGDPNWGNWGGFLIG